MHKAIHRQQISRRVTQQWFNLLDDLSTSKISSNIPMHQIKQQPIDMHNCHSRVTISSRNANASGKVRPIYCRHLFLSTFVNSNSAVFSFDNLFSRAGRLDAWHLYFFIWDNFWIRRLYSWTSWHPSNNKTESHCIFGDSYINCLQHLLAVPCPILRLRATDD